MTRTVEIVSPFAPEEFAARLTRAIDPGGMERVVPGSKPVIGRVDGRSVWLRKRIRYRNGFQTVLVGTLEECEAGCRFRGCARMQWATQVLTTIWLGGMFVVGVWVCMMFLVRGGNPGGLLMAPLFLSLGAGVVLFGRWLARDEERFPTAFVVDATCAQLGNLAQPLSAPPD